MIKVLVYDSGHGPRRRISISSCGHAESGVCCKVSTALDMVAGHLLNYAAYRGGETEAKVLTQEGGERLIIECEVYGDEAIHKEVDAIMWALTTCLDAIGKTRLGRDHLEVEYLVEMSKHISDQDCLDCVAEWRTANGFDPVKMKPPDLK